MTAFALTETQRAFADQVREIAAARLRPIAEAGRPGHVNREVRAPRIYEGASEVQRSIIARELYR